MEWHYDVILCMTSVIMTSHRSHYWYFCEENSSRADAYISAWKNIKPLNSMMDIKQPASGERCGIWLCFGWESWYHTNPHQPDSVILWNSSLDCVSFVWYPGEGGGDQQADWFWFFVHRICICSFVICSMRPWPAS